MRHAIGLAALGVAGVLALGAGSGGGDDETADRIVGAALLDGGAYDKLAHLTDYIGPRLSGSPNLEKAVTWAEEEFRGDGLDKVWTEPVTVPHWVRGAESGRIVAPADHPLVLTTLGMSDPTPEGGITADVIEVPDFDELHQLGEDRVRGKIVLYNKAILPNGGKEHGYGSAFGLRWSGASEAAKLGGVGALIRSLGTADYRLPHTGAMGYEEGVPHVPAAAISAEDADLIHRLLASGQTVRVHFELGCRTLPDAQSANVLADLRGCEKPQEIVLLGAHLDSWDVGMGAIDDGAGVAIIMQTMRLLHSLGRAPRRTVRAVLFTNEENGLRGGRAYAEAHAAELEHHVAAIESDSGGAAPLGFNVNAGPGGEEMLRRLAARLEVIGASEVTSPGGGADISGMRPAGVPQIGLRQDTTHYFDYHHTMADTLDKVAPDDLRKNVAALALLAWELADSPETLPRLEPEPGDHP